VTQPAPSKITYTSASADMTAFHQAFDEALARLRGRLGEAHPLHVGAERVEALAEPLVDTSPIDTSLVIGRFSAATPAHVDAAVRAARAAQPSWERTPWRERIATMRRAAALIRERKYDVAAAMSLEVGKSRLEAMGDAEESADLIDYYCQQLEDAGGFVKQMGRLAPNENAVSVLRPFGVFACIAPFNFPMALSTGMSAAALVAGNAVVYKPAQDAPLTGLLLLRVYRDAGVPPGAFSYLTGRGSVMGDAMWQHPGVDGVVFTGSKAVGMHMFHAFSRDWVKPCLLELGGKNAAVVTESADLDMAAEGVMKSAFGLQGQKCSACSRVYVDARVADAFLERLLARTAAIVKGDPTQKDVYFGPVVNEKAMKTYLEAAGSAAKGGRILAGGKRMSEGSFARGWYVEPAVAELPLDHELFLRELFVPFLSVGRVSGLDEAIAQSNKVEYGLTAGIFTARREEIERFFERVEAGVCYANRRSGATTGAWPGVNPFCGWKGSGSTGKGGCGPYYVAQFMREQSRTIME